MEPIWWVFLFFCLCGVAAMIAKKKKRSGMAFFFGSAIPAVLLALLVSYGWGSNMQTKIEAMAFVAFLCPLVGIIAAIMADGEEQKAVKLGVYGDLKKCPFCAEAVRKEAVKCKHCGSNLAEVESVVAL